MGNHVSESDATISKKTVGDPGRGIAADGAISNGQLPGDGDAAAHPADGVLVSVVSRADVIPADRAVGDHHRVGRNDAASVGGGAVRIDRTSDEG